MYSQPVTNTINPTACIIPYMYQHIHIDPIKSPVLQDFSLKIRILKVKGTVNNVSCSL